MTHFIKYVDYKGRTLYKENEFDMTNHRLVGMNIILEEKQDTIRKKYTSNCTVAKRHLYTNKLGKRIKKCIHCGEKILKQYTRKRRNND